MSAAPLQFLLLVFAGWVNRRQREVVEYLQEENRFLREQLGDCRLRFTDDQRRRLAAKGRALGRRVLSQLRGLVTPDTILRWYRELKCEDSVPGRWRLLSVATERTSWSRARIVSRSAHARATFASPKALWVT